MYTNKASIQRESFVIQVSENFQSSSQVISPSSNKLINFSAMKLFDRFRKIVMRFVFPVPTSGRRRSSRAGETMSASGPGSGQRRRSCDRPDPPKTSCSSYYSSTSHYNEAIADCIEFFNKSSQDQGIFSGRKSDVIV
ncbi:uncharacterized protein LOC125856798 [Solanum stenotomum]|uniref:uncharacterized protein LOC125856798 n=1 Tax=Solanum stenotomum TaxID=172797 RepID=UPI0020D06D8C|nr:uncharacterized protein LOC125856798 [Solanum stenotomum]